MKTKTRASTESMPPDGGWGWIVCLTAFWTNGTVFGILNNFGILFVELLREFDNDEGDIAFKTSWIGTLQISTTFFMSPFVSIFVDKFGIRPTAFVGGLLATAGMLASSFVYRLEVMYVTYGLLLGLGSSLVYTPSMVILGHYFRKYLGVVNGAVTFGSAIFTMGLSFLLKNVLLKHYGLRQSMQALSILLGVLMLCALTWKPLLQENSEEDRKRTKALSMLHSTESLMAESPGPCSGTFKSKIWKNKSFIIWVIGLPIAFLGYFVPFVHLVKHSEDVFPDHIHQTQLIVMGLGAASGVSRLISGIISDQPGVNRVRMQQLAFLFLGIATSFIPFATNFYALVVIVLVMGICDGCFICLLGPIAFDILGPAGAAQGIGSLLGLMSIPMTAGPPLAGLAYDLMHTYKIAFLAAGTPPMIGACVLFLMPVRKHETTVLNSVIDINN